MYPICSHTRIVTPGTHRSAFRASFVHLCMTDWVPFSSYFALCIPVLESEEKKEEEKKTSEGESVCHPDELGLTMRNSWAEPVSDVTLQTALHIRKQSHIRVFVWLMSSNIRRYTVTASASLPTVHVICTLFLTTTFRMTKAAIRSALFTSEEFIAIVISIQYCILQLSKYNRSEWVLFCVSQGFFLMLTGSAVIEKYHQWGSLHENLSHSYAYKSLAIIIYKSLVIKCDTAECW